MTPFASQPITPDPHLFNRRSSQDYVIIKIMDHDLTLTPTPLPQGEGLIVPTSSPSPFAERGAGGEVNSSPLKPPLKWAGGKRWLIPHLEPIWREHRHRRLVEPLCDGLAVSLGLLPTQAILNDMNPHLIKFYRWVQPGLQITIPMRYDKDLYYAHRVRFNTLIRQGEAQSQEAAELFYYLNRTG